MRKLLCFVLIAMLVPALFGCGSQPASPASGYVPRTPTPTPNAGYTNNSPSFKQPSRPIGIYQDGEPVILLGDTRQKVLEVLGEDRIGNIHTERHASYEELRVEFTTDGVVSGFWLFRNEKYTDMHGFGYGTPSADVRAFYGLTGRFPNDDSVIFYDKSFNRMPELLGEAEFLKRWEYDVNYSNVFGDKIRSINMRAVRGQDGRILTLEN